MSEPPRPSRTVSPGLVRNDETLRNDEIASGATQVFLKRGVRIEPAHGRQVSPPFRKQAMLVRAQHFAGVPPDRLQALRREEGGPQFRGHEFAERQHPGMEPRAGFPRERSAEGEALQVRQGPLPAGLPRLH